MAADELRPGPRQPPGYAWGNEANSFDVLFKQSLGTGFMRFGVKTADFARSPQSATAVTGQRSGDRNPASRITYPGVFRAVDLQYNVLANEIKETVVLADAPTPTHYRFVLTPPGDVPVEAQEQPDGSWAFFVAPNGGPVFVLEVPYAVEATPERTAMPVADPHASMEVRRVADDFLVDLAIDEKWLHDPAQKFPVRIDPTITTSPTQQRAPPLPLLRHAQVGNCVFAGMCHFGCSLVTVD